MKHLKSKKLNVRKAVSFVIASNVIQVLTLLVATVYVACQGERYGELAFLAMALLLVFWGAVLDIREALRARSIAEQADMLEEAYTQLEALNGTLRKQRHDFMNHLQVVFSLMEMREFDEAAHYVESVYADIQRTGSALKTAIPAVNALIAAKRADCEALGIAFNVDIRSSWEALPVSGWEMCRVLGNLIDNARDALTEGGPKAGARIDIILGEQPAALTFSIANNGPAIAPEHLGELFRMGFTTKRDGHGYGLSVVSDILKAYGGGISVKSDPYETVFSGVIPRHSAANAEKSAGLQSV